MATKRIQCDCKKIIEYIDRVVGGTRAEHAIIVCEKCGKEHEITFDGFLSEIKGGRLKQT